MTLTTDLTKQLRLDEGVRESAYQDHLGFWTIGVGRLIDERKGGGLRPEEIDYLLLNDISDRIHALTSRLPWFYRLDEARQGVLLNMAFQLGTEGLMGFVNTLACVRDGNYPEAAQRMLASKWATQTPARARRMAEQMISGEFQFAE